MAAETLDDGKVTLSMRDVPVDELLAVISRRLACSLTRVGNVYYLGQPLPQDRAVMVRRVTNMTPETAAQVLGVYTSEYGRVIVTPSGVAVVGDHMEVVSRMSAMLDQVEAAEPGTWLVQLYLFSMAETYARDLGIEGATTIDLAATITSAGTSSAIASSGLKALVKASNKNDSIRLTTSPLFVLIEGQLVELDDGQTVPIPQRAVSPEGTTTTTSYQFMKTGLGLKLRVRPSSNARATLELEYSSTTITRYVEGAPVTDGLTLKTQSQIEPGGVYLLGEVKHKTNTQSDEIGMTVRTQKEMGDRIFQVWARAIRIGGLQRPD